MQRRVFHSHLRGRVLLRTEVAAVLLLPFERGLECSAPNFINEANFCQQEAASAAAVSPSPSPKDVCVAADGPVEGKTV
jgi:hypothetical protein